MKKKQKTAEYKKTLAIVSLYDPDGIVDNYIIFFLSSLKNVVDRMIVAVNGKVTEEGKRKLKMVTDEIYIRKNTGFDFGAYKDVLENYMAYQEIAVYKELILCNDTCFGPLISFKDIFARMCSADIKVWSINYIDDVLLPHFQSYFMIFREEAIELVLRFLHCEVDSTETVMEQAHGYEHALSEVILQSGIKTDFYTSNIEMDHNIDIFGAPDYAIKNLGFPMLKKKILSEEICQKENCVEALRLISQEGKYPLNYILETGERVYHRDFSKEVNNTYLSEIRTFEKNDTTRERVIEFCHKYKKIYVYGNGYMSVLFMARFRRYMNEFLGYIVSDECYKNSTCKGDPIYPLSQIDKDMPIIVALMKESSIQVMDKIKDRKKVLFLSIKHVEGNDEG